MKLIDPKTLVALICVLVLNSGPAFAQAAAPGPSTLELLIMPLGFLVIMYFLIFRPQQKKAKELKDLIDNLKVGDEILTSGGIIGRVKSIAEQFVTIELSGQATAKVIKSSVTGLTKGSAPSS